MNVLDLFSGIGGFSLGLERAGMRTVAFCEIDPYCRAVLRKHWPDVPVWGDVRELRSLQADIDLICGGFPCQDISVAGKGAGIEGSRSGLWSEYARIIGEVRPRYVIVENVAALLGRGIERVLGDLAALGFDAEWHCIPASAIGAPHRRDRVWIVGYANAVRCGWWPHNEGQASAERDRTASSGNASDANVRRCEGEWQQKYSIEQGASRNEPNGFCAPGWRHRPDVADTYGTGLSASECQTLFAAGRWEEGRAAAECGWWRSEPDVGRVAYGIPFRVDRLRALGNALVPQIAEIIGKAIMSHV